MRLLRSGIILLALMSLLSVAVSAQTKKKKKTVKKPMPNTTTPVKSSTVSTAPPTENEISGGLKEALVKGVKFAVDSLGKENGFLGDVRVKIPLPKSLQTVEKGLKLIGQQKMVDEFVTSMNRAAEKAVPVAIDVFVDSVKQMTFQDAKNILTGGDDAATQFFRRTSEETLRGKFRPLVEKFTEEVGVTQKYKAMLGKYPLASALIGKEAQDLDGYVTQKALDGLFFMVAEEEKKIRKDPIGRTTDLLRKVFGSIFK